MPGSWRGLQSDPNAAATLQVLSDPVRIIAQATNSGLFMASPSIEILPSGRMLVVLERMQPWGKQPEHVWQKEVRCIGLLLGA